MAINNLNALLFSLPPDLSEQQWGGIVLNEGWDDFTDFLSRKMIAL